MGSAAPSSWPPPGDLEVVEHALAARGAPEEAALVYGLASPSAVAAHQPQGWESLGQVPVLVRPLRLSAVSDVLPGLPLLAPFGRKRRTGVREISDLPADVRITRLWDRFSVDVGVALERTTKLFAWRIHARPARACSSSRTAIVMRSVHSAYLRCRGTCWSCCKRHRSLYFLHTLASHGCCSRGRPSGR